MTAVTSQNKSLAFDVQKNCTTHTSEVVGFTKGVTTSQARQVRNTDVVAARTITYMKSMENDHQRISKKGTFTAQQSLNIGFSQSDVRCRAGNAFGKISTRYSFCKMNNTVTKIT